MIVLRSPGYYSYLDPGLVHTEYGFVRAAYDVADDCTIQAGLVFKEEGLADLAARALEIFLRAGVEYRGVNVALAVYQAILERMPGETFRWDTTGLEDVLVLWPMYVKAERAKVHPELRETPSEELLKLPREEDSPELVPFLPVRIAPVPTELEEAVPVEEVPPLEVEVPPVEVEVPPIYRPPVVPPVEPRRRPPVEVTVPPVEVAVPPVEVAVPELERPPTVSEVAEEIAEKIGELTGLDYGEIRKIVEQGVDRLSERFQDPGLVAGTTMQDELDVSEEAVKGRLIREMRVMKEAAFESVKDMEIEDREWDYPVTLPGA